MSRPIPYVGVSGICTRAEAEAAIAAFPDCGRQLMLGVLVSAKTLDGQRNKWWRRYPPVERIAGIFSDDPRALNLVHVAVDDPAGVSSALDLAMVYGGPHCHGVQLNIAWPASSEGMEVLQHQMDWVVREWHPERIVMQLRDVMSTCVIDRAREAQKSGATDVLLDASGGRGLGIDVGVAALVVQRIRRACPDLGIGIAGGLEAATIPPVAPLLRDDLNCDAEGRLRDDADGGGNLVPEEVAAYLRATGEAVMK